MQLKPVKLALMLAVAVAGLLATTSEASADRGGRSRHYGSYSRYSRGCGPSYYAPRSWGPSYYSSYRSYGDCGDRYYAPRGSGFGFSFGYSSGRSYYNDCGPRYRSYSDCGPRYYGRSYYSRRGCR